MTSSLLFNITTFAYFISMLAFFAFLASRTKAVGTAAMLVAYGGLLAQSVAISLRWKESYDLGMGHAPLSNLYESVVFFSWTIVLIYALLDIKFKYRVIGAFVMPFALLGMAWAQLGMNTGNASVQIFNTSIRTFPNSLTNSMLLHLQRKEPFKADEDAKVTSKVKL